MTKRLIPGPQPVLTPLAEPELDALIFKAKPSPAATDASTAGLVALLRHATLWSPVADRLYNPVHLDVSLAAPACDEAA